MVRAAARRHHVPRAAQLPAASVLGRDRHRSQPQGARTSRHVATRVGHPEPRSFDLTRSRRSRHTDPAGCTGDARLVLDGHLAVLPPLDALPRRARGVAPSTSRCAAWPRRLRRRDETLRVLERSPGRERDVAGARGGCGHGSVPRRGRSTARNESRRASRHDQLVQTANSNHSPDTRTLRPIDRAHLSRGAPCPIYTHCICISTSRFTIKYAPKCTDIVAAATALSYVVSYYDTTGALPMLPTLVAQDQFAPLARSPALEMIPKMNCIDLLTVLFMSMK